MSLNYHFVDINYLVVIAITNLFIFAFYSFFRMNWPEEYFGEEDNLSLAISVTLKRLLLFRAMPVFIICFVLFSYLDSMNFTTIQWVVFGSITAFIYALLTSGVSLIKIILKNKSVRIFTNKPTQILYHILSIIFLLIIGSLSGFASSFMILDHLSTNVRSLVDNIVASIIFSAIVAPLYKGYRLWTSASNEGVDKIIQKSIKEIRNNKKLFEFIKNTCEDKNANLNLVLSFCVVENIQRPKWFRKIENYFPISKTKGIMQVKSFYPISDEDSVNLAINKYFLNTKDIKINNAFIEKLVSKYYGEVNEKYILFIERTLDNINYSWSR